MPLPNEPAAGPLGMSPQSPRGHLLETAELIRKHAAVQANEADELRKRAKEASAESERLLGRAREYERAAAELNLITDEASQ